MVEPTLADRLAAVPALDLGGALCRRGAVVQVGDGVARVVGLERVGSEELVAFDSGAIGMAYELDTDGVGVVLLARTHRVRAGEGVAATGRLPSVPVGRALFGRILDPLGRPLDGRAPPTGERRSVFRAAPALIERAPVSRPLLTGIMAIDAAIPIGRGQRQLVVGDRNVGKTSLALDAVAAQRRGDVACVYVVVGQPLSRVLGIRESLLESGALANTILIAADAADAPGLQYLAPYAGATVAECFRDDGRDALVVYDDLTKHADVYRELALLLGRPPGREAFPGDIFYVHAQLLERATPLAAGGSVTALPIVETTDGDLSGYIPTNLVSITDGQVYLDAGRFERNQRPAIDVGRSVSRVGGVAQPKAMRAASRSLRIAISRFESLEALTRVGLDVDEATRRTVERGRVVRELLRQPRGAPRRLASQVFAVTAASAGWLDALPPSAASDAVWSAAARLGAELPDVVAAIEVGTEPPPDADARMRALLERAIGAST